MQNDQIYLLFENHISDLSEELIISHDLSARVNTFPSRQWAPFYMSFDDNERNFILLQRRFNGVKAYKIMMNGTVEDQIVFQRNSSLSSIEYLT